jgi:Glycosyl transferase family 2
VTDTRADLVSVVVPAFNAAATLDETLRSVRGQTHRALEIIVVDDGSTDATRMLAERHAAADARVQVLHQANAGVAAARNAGWRHARSELIAFLDADDLWAPTKIERQLDAIQRAGPELGLAYCWFARIDMSSRIVALPQGSPWQGDVMPSILRSNFIGNGSAALVRRAVLEAVGGFDGSLKARGAQGCEDYLFYFRVARSYRFALVPQPLVGYRFLSHNMSSNRPRMLASWIIAQQEMLAQQPRHARLIRQGARDYALWLMNEALSAGANRQLAPLLQRMATVYPGAALKMSAIDLPRAWARHRWGGRSAGRRSDTGSADTLIGQPFAIGAVEPTSASSAGAGRE